jgi:hypothetical protein
MRKAMKVICVVGYELCLNTGDRWKYREHILMPYVPLGGGKFYAQAVDLLPL